MMTRRLLPLPALCAALALSASLPAQTPFDENAAERATRHQTPAWFAVADHLPDPLTASPEKLEQAGDILRARRLPEDALDYYGYAMARGANPARELNRVGVTQLELHETNEARLTFKRVIALNRKDAEAWNNLGATEYVAGDFRGAIGDYRRALKLNKKAAIYHANLGTAYFEQHEYESATNEFQLAAKLDPGVFQHNGFGGVEAHILSPSDRGRFCFEMAKLAAAHGDDEAVLQWLTKSSETGFDVHYQMAGVKELRAYYNDPRVALILKNAKALRSHQLATAGPAPALPPESTKMV